MDLEDDVGEIARLRLVVGVVFMLLVALIVAFAGRAED